ncbi:MAG: TonB family protein [Proteobacteria bacterium]|nr:TonB family protein [Pseudomonadota bacterium]
MRVLLAALLMTLSPAFADGSPVMNDVRPPAASAQDPSVEIDWFQNQTAEVHRRWVKTIGTVPGPIRQATDGSRARIDVRIDGDGRVVSARVGHSTGNTTLDGQLLDALEDARLAPPPASLPDDAGFVRFSVYFDLAARAEREDESPADAV